MDKKEERARKRAESRAEWREVAPYGIAGSFFIIGIMYCFVARAGLMPWAVAYFCFIVAFVILDTKLIRSLLKTIKENYNKQGESDTPVVEEDKHEEETV